MPFDITTAVPIIEKEGNTFAKTKFDIANAVPYSVEDEKVFGENSNKGQSLVTYEPTWQDKINKGLEFIGLKPEKLERIGKAQAQVSEARQMKDEKGIDFDEALLTILSRERADPIGALNTVKDMIVRTPPAIVSAVFQMDRGMDAATVTDKGWVTRLIKNSSKDNEDFVKEVQRNYREKRIIPGVPIKVSDIAQLPESLAFSIVSMGTGLATGASIAILPVPGSRVAAWSAGTVASGAAAFNMSAFQIMQEFLEFHNEKSIDNTGIGITPEREKELKASFKSKAIEFGLWEAIPEAISNLAFASLLTAPLTKMVGASLAQRIAARLAGIYGEELITETVTEKGQTRIRRKAGLEKIPEGETADITWAEALQRIAPQTFLLTTIMAGAGAALVKTKQVLQKSLKKEIGVKHSDFKRLSEGAEDLVIVPGEAFEGSGEIASAPDVTEKVITPIKKAPKITPKVVQQRAIEKEAVALETVEEQVIQKDIDRIAQVEQKIKDIQIELKQAPAKIKREVKVVQNEVINLIEEANLEAKDKAKFLRAVKNVQTFQQLKKNIDPILERIARTKEQTQKRKAITGFKKAVKRANVKKLRPEFREKLQPILDSINIKTPTQAKIAKLQSMLDFVERQPENQIPAHKLRELQTLERVPLSEFSLEQIQDLTDTVNHLANLSRLKDKIIFQRKLREFEDIRNKAIDNVNTRSEKFPDAVDGLDTFQQRKETGFFARIFGTDSYNAELKTDILDNKEGGEIQQVIFTGIDRGVSDQFRFEHQAEDFFKEKIKGIDIDIDTNSWSKAFQKKAKNITKVSVNISGDRTLTFTKGERVAFILHTLNERNTRHLEEGGFSFVGKESKINKLTPEDIDTIVASATVEEIKVADAILEYYNTIQKDAINKASVELIGYPLAREENFSPIRTNALDRKKEILTKRGNFERVSIEGAGWTQERVNAKNALILEDAFTALYKSIHSVSGYVGLAQPLRAAKSLLESNEFQKSVIDVGRKHYLDSLKSYIQRVEGVITNMDNVDVLTQELINRLDSSILGLNPFVMLKQPVSYFLASTEMDIRFMQENPLRKVTESEIAEMRKWHPQIRDRLGGNVTTELGELARVGRVKKFFTGKEVVGARTLKGIRNMDTRAIGAIWRAVKTEIREKNPDLQGDAFMEKVSERAWDIIRKTQPTFHVKDRSTIGMSKNVFIRLLTKYSSQRNKNWMIIRRAITRYNRSNKNANAKAKLTSSLVMVSVVNALMISLINLARGLVFSDKDKKELFTKGILDFVQTNIGNIYFLGTAFGSLVSKVTRGSFIGFDVNTTVSTFINEGVSTAAEFIRGIGAVITGEEFQKGKHAGEKKWHESVKKFATGAIDITGRLKGVNTKIIRNFLMMPFNIWKRFFGDADTKIGL